MTKKATKQSKKEHPDWLELYNSNREYREKVNVTIERSGTPLETKVKALFNKFGYRATSGHYVDEDNGVKKQREIDVVAHGQTQEFQIKNDNIDLSILVSYTVLGECKFYSEDQLLMFEVDEKKHGNLMLRLPHFVNGSYLYSFMHNKTISEANCTKLVGTSEYSDKILVFRPPENNTPKRSDNDIYPACEQVMPALAHYLERNMDHVKTDYYNFLQQNSLFEKFAEATNQFRKEEQGKFDEYYSKKAIETILKDINKTYLSGHLTINILVPLLIFDENTRLTKVVLDDEWKVKELVEIPSCVYLHTPSTFDRYSQVLNELYHQPILVCNYAHLSECIENITKGIKAIAEEIQKNSKDPKRVAETVLKGFYLRQEPIMSWPSH